MLAALHQARLPISMGVLVSCLPTTLVGLPMSLLFSHASPACGSSFPPYLGWTQSTTQWGP
eukprot:2856924-Pleurochrysis_carterae.AAC.1